MYLKMQITLYFGSPCVNGNSLFSFTFPIWFEELCIIHYFFLIFHWSINIIYTALIIIALKTFWLQSKSITPPLLWRKLMVDLGLTMQCNYIVLYSIFYLYQGLCLQTKFFINHQLLSLQKKHHWLSNDFV